MADKTPSEGEVTVELVSTPPSPDWANPPRRVASVRLPVVRPETYDVGEEVARGGLGRVMKAALEKLGAAADGKLVSEAAKRLLSGA